MDISIDIVLAETTAGALYQSTYYIMVAHDIIIIVVTLLNSFYTVFYILYISNLLFALNVVINIP